MGNMQPSINKSPEILSDLHMPGCSFVFSYDHLSSILAKLIDRPASSDHHAGALNLQTYTPVCYNWKLGDVYDKNNRFLMLLAKRMSRFSTKG